MVRRRVRTRPRPLRVFDDRERRGSLRGSAIGECRWRLWRSRFVAPPLDEGRLLSPGTGRRGIVATYSPRGPERRPQRGGGSMKGHGAKGRIAVLLMIML